MSQRELQRVRVLERLAHGALSLSRAAALMGVSYRQAKRLKIKYREFGPAGLAHGNRGKPPNNKLSSELREKILRLSWERYAGCNDTHFTELLAEQEGIELGRESVRCLRRAAGIDPKRKRRAKQHHKRRERRASRGEMVQWDGSPHRWFGPDQPPCCLLSAVDDATSELLAARFEPTEGSLGYMRLLWSLVSRHGLPLAIYHDRHSALWRNDEHWSLEEQLAGEQEPKQVGRALRELGIEAIPAYSPQAKGRIERQFGTQQDRLVAELGLQGITSIDQANAWLEQVYTPRYNRRFAKTAANPRSAFRRPGKLDLQRAISFRYATSVGNDNAVRLGGLIIDIPPGPAGRGYAKAHVEVRQLLDGSWRVYYQDRLIATHGQTAIHTPIQARIRSNKSKGACNWTWVYQESAP